MKRRASSTVELSKDWSEFVELLVAHRVKFLLVGAHALAALGRPRYTGDLDIWVEASPANAKRVCAALTDFGFGQSADLDYFSTAGKGLQGLALGVAPMRVDVLKSITGLSFAEAWRTRTRARFGKRTIHVIGRRAYMKNKRAAGRTKDLLDLALLEEVDAPKPRRRPPR